MIINCTIGAEYFLPLGAEIKWLMTTVTKRLLLRLVSRTTAAADTCSILTPGHVYSCWRPLFFYSRFCLFSHSVQLWLWPLNIHRQSCNHWKWIRASQLTSMHANNSNSRVNQLSLWVHPCDLNCTSGYVFASDVAFFTFKCFAPLSEHDSYLTGSDLRHSGNTSNTAPIRMPCQIH